MKHINYNQYARREGTLRNVCEEIIHYTIQTEVEREYRLEGPINAWSIGFMLINMPWNTEQQTYVSAAEYINTAPERMCIYHGLKSVEYIQRYLNSFMNHIVPSPGTVDRHISFVSILWAVQRT